MKNILKIGVVVAFCGVSAFFLFSNPVNAGSAPAVKSALETVSGPRELYLQNCARCHGADGRSNTDKGRELDADDLTALKTKHKSVAKLAAAIGRGKGDMPGFSKRLRAAQITSIARYIKTL